MKPFVKVSQRFAMPNSETFSIKPIGLFVRRYLHGTSIDPFARNKDWYTYSNDLDPKTSAQYHMDAVEFLQLMHARGVRVDVGIFDPPYSPRQIAECYKSIGLKVGMEETQNGRLYKAVRDAMDKLIKPGGIVLSFGWQSMGMGAGRNYEQVELMLVQHGGAHNDTICVAERKMSSSETRPEEARARTEPAAEV